MNNNLFSVLLSTIKARITPIVTKLKYWMSPAFWRAQILTRIREWLTKVFAVSPRNKHDYYGVFGWLVSRRLAHAVVIVSGLLALAYLLFVDPVFQLAEGVGSGEKSYAYNALPLRFTKGDVKIRAKSGYVAYEGAVSKGYATGSGTLYAKDGGVVYRGAFEKNRYNGEGTLYYPNGQARYQGEFENNLFQGSGKLFRENGTMLYAGEFEAGLREGTGTLYNAAETPVFTGSFHSDELVYSQFLGKSATDISSLYTGDKLIYMGDGEAVQMMPDIDAFYVADTTEESIEESLVAEQLYVCKDTFIYGDSSCRDIEEVKQVLGDPVFEGNSYVLFPEAVGIHWMQEQGSDVAVDVSLETEHPIKEAYNVTGYDEDAILYLYVFQKEETSYTFLCEDRDSTFFMYGLSR
jgi:hypothetical protein